MKLTIEENKESGKARAYFGEGCEHFSDSEYYEYELVDAYHVAELVEWALQVSYSAGVDDGRRE
jgi:hypothetical protein